MSVKKWFSPQSLLTLILCIALSSIDSTAGAESQIEAQEQQPVNILSVSGTTATVRRWDEFVDVLGNKSVSVIDVQADLTRPGVSKAYDPGTIARDLTIVGNGHTINFGASSTSSNGIILGTVPASVNLILSDIYLVNPQALGTSVFNQVDAAASSNWNIILEDVRTGTGNATGLIAAENALVTIYGAGNNLSSSYGSSLFNVGELKLVSNADLTIASTNDRASAYLITVGRDLIMGAGSKLKATSFGASLFQIGGNFTVGEYAAITTKTTNGAARQFFVNNFTINENAVITTTSNGPTYQFYITGNFTMESGGTEGTGASLTANSTGASNSIIYMLGGGTIDLGAYTTTKLTNSGTVPGTLTSPDGTNTPNRSHGIYGEIGVLNMQPHSLLEIDAANTGYRSLVNTSVIMTDGAVFNASAKSNTAVALCANYADTYPTTAKVTMSGEGTQMNLGCSSKTKGINGAALRVAGKDCSFDVINGAQINSHSEFGTGLQFQGPGTVFNVKNGGRVEVIQEDDNGYALGSSLRFRVSGNQTFNIDNGEVVVKKLNGYAAAVRLRGGTNAINVTNGGIFKVYNAGNGIPKDGNSDKGNQGIYYTGGGANKPDSFAVDGYESRVEITADYGPAIFTDGGSSVTATDQSIFILEGRTEGASNGILSSDEGISIMLDNPLYFDMRNNRPGGGNVLAAGSGTAGRNSTFTAQNSDLAVWAKGSNLNKNPVRTWSLFNYALQGRYFETIVSTNIPGKFNIRTYGSGGASEYSRMSANNTNAIVDSLRVPTNADKHIYGHVSIPEGIEGFRDVWADEVYVSVNVYNADNTLAYEGLTGITAGTTSNGSNQGISVYGEPEQGGIFVIDVPNGKFLETGQWIKVMSVWRGDANPNSTQVHTGTADDLKADDVTVYDVMPPTAITVDDLDESVLIHKGNLAILTKTISGTSKDIGATVCLYKNNTVWATTTVSMEGKWSITFPDVLTEGDTIAVALNDNVLNTDQLTAYDLAKLIDNGIFSNNGNENPPADFAFHDAVFAGRLELGVIAYSGALELTVSSEISYGTHKISPGQKSYPAEAIELQVEDSRASRNKWELTARLEKPFTRNGGSDVLNIALVYSYNGTETVIGSSQTNIWSHTNTTNIFDIYNEWTTEDSENGLYVKACAGQVKIGSYTAKVNWTLSDVP